jgi:hypothetical protein
MEARPLDGISLAELTERADLQTRVDRKYLIPVEHIDDLLAELEPGTRMLEIGGKRSFGYRSVYFDTPDLAAYHAAARRQRRRFKVRTRSYLDSDLCWVEVKTRGARSSTVKNRLAHPSDRPSDLDLVGEQFVAEVLEDATIALADPTGLRPTLTTQFVRTTLHLPQTESRVTIDRDLVWSAADRPGERLALIGLAVVETKTGATPSSADRVLWRHGLRPSRVSKYGTGMAALHPDLPATPWRRTLDRQVLDHSRALRACN